VSSDSARPALRVKHGNWFWHAVEACDKVFIQEYGESPTGIYVSEDLKSFKLLVTNKDIDPLSRHFHYIAFDKKRNVLIATLGDGNVEEFVDRIESLVSLSKGEVMDIGMKLKERAGKLFDKERIEHEITNSLMSILS
jgi:hypothetical protein